jgi:hypothetical protein
VRGPDAARLLRRSRLLGPRYRKATHRAVSARPAGLAHRPDDAQAGPREDAGSRRAAAFIGRETSGSPRTRSSDLAIRRYDRNGDQAEARARRAVTGGRRAAAPGAVGDVAHRDLRRSQAEAATTDLMSRDEPRNHRERDVRLLVGFGTHSVEHPRRVATRPSRTARRVARNGGSAQRPPGRRYVAEDDLRGVVAAVRRVLGWLVAATARRAAVVPPATRHARSNRAGAPSQLPGVSPRVGEERSQLAGEIASALAQSRPGPCATPPAPSARTQAIG